MFGYLSTCYLLFIFLIVNSYTLKKLSSFKIQSTAVVDHPDHAECPCKWLMGILGCILDQLGSLSRGFSVSSMLEYSWKASLFTVFCLYIRHLVFHPQGGLSKHSHHLHHKLSASPFMWDNHLWCFLCWLYYMRNHCIHVDDANCKPPYRLWITPFLFITLPVITSIEFYLQKYLLSKRWLYQVESVP